MHKIAMNTAFLYTYYIHEYPNGYSEQGIMESMQLSHHEHQTFLG